MTVEQTTEAKSPETPPPKKVSPIGMIIGLLVIATGGYFGWQYLQPMFEPKKVEVVHDDGPGEAPCAEVVRKTLDRVDQLPGEIQAYQDVALFPKIPGFIEWIGIDRGSVVKKGDVLVKMYAPEYLAKRNEALAKVQESQSMLKRAESKLISDKARLKEAIATWRGDDSTYARLKAASLTPGVVAYNDVVVLSQRVEADKETVNSWESRVKASEKEVSALADSVSASKRSADNYEDFASYLNIVAPFDGYITVRNMHKGSFVGPLGFGAYPAIAKIAQLQLLRIVVPVPERDTSAILPGSQVQFTVSSHPGVKFTGTVARIGNYLDQSTRTMPVELNYSNPDYKIFPGAFCKVYWPARRREASLFVPISSVVSTTLDNHVCRVQDGIVRCVKVEKGQTMDNLVEVFGDLKEGDQVILRASEEISDGQQVRATLVSKEDAGKAPEPRPSYHESVAN
ncbi:MAG: efflux RND transporter periplasmic adaptor subunit [Candidatus Obscuribacterales bacterium]|nr:efflux RND transporter periplasmic adaptor subunit [Candidatus Obscuribacterales bacterium]